MTKSKARLMVVDTLPGGVLDAKYETGTENRDQPIPSDVPLKEPGPILKFLRVSLLHHFQFNATLFRGHVGLHPMGMEDETR